MLDIKPGHSSQVIHFNFQELKEFVLDTCERGGLVCDVSLDVGAHSVCGNRSEETI